MAKITQCSDIADLTPSGMAELLAKVATTTGRQQKQADWWGDAQQGLQKAWADPVTGNAMLGGGIGAGAGLLHAVTDKNRRKSWLSRTLLGGALGAVGGAAIPALRGSQIDSEEDIARKAAEAAEIARRQKLPYVDKVVEDASTGLNVIGKGMTGGAGGPGLISEDLGRRAGVDAAGFALGYAPAREMLQNKMLADNKAAIDRMIINESTSDKRTGLRTPSTINAKAVDATLANLKSRTSQAQLNAQAQRTQQSASGYYTVARTATPHAQYQGPTHPGGVIQPERIYGVPYNGSAAHDMFNRAARLSGLTEPYSSGKPFPQPRILTAKHQAINALAAKLGHPAPYIAQPGPIDIPKATLPTIQPAAATLSQRLAYRAAQGRKAVAPVTAMLPSLQSAAQVAHNKARMNMLPNMSQRMAPRVGGTLAGLGTGYLMDRAYNWLQQKAPVK